MIDRRQFTKLGITSAVAGLSAPGLLNAETQRALRVLAPNGSQANLRPVIESFHSATGRSAELMIVDVNEINSVLTLEALTGEFGLDVALPATFGIPDLVEAEAILPFENVSLQAKTYSSDGLMYQVGDFYDGQRWGYQTDGDVFLMFYNKSLLESTEHQKRFSNEFGTPLEIARTWAELDQQLEFFHAPDQGTYGGCLFRSPSTVAWEWWARFHAKAVWPFAPDMSPQINSDAGLETLDEMRSSMQFLTGKNLDLFGNWDRYKQGDVFANIGWGGTQKSLFARQSAMRGQIVNGQLPGVDLGEQVIPMSFFNWGWSYVVARRSTQRALAQLFCLHSVSPATSALAIAQADGFFDPFRQDQYDELAIIEAYGQDFLKAHRTAMASPIPDLYLARRSEYFDALNYWVYAALDGEVTPQNALASIEASWNTTTQRAGRSAQVRRWAALKASYPESLRRVLVDVS